MKTWQIFLAVPNHREASKKGILDKLEKWAHGNLMRCRVLGNPRHKYRLGDSSLRDLWRKIQGGWALKAQHDPAILTCSPGSQSCPGMCIPKQDKGGGSASPLCPHEASPGVLYPLLGPQHKKDMNQLQMVQRGHEDYPRNEPPLL